MKLKIIATIIFNDSLMPEAKGKQIMKRIEVEITEENFLGFISGIIESKSYSHTVKGVPEKIVLFLGENSDQNWKQKLEKGMLVGTARSEQYSKYIDAFRKDGWKEMN